MFGHYFCTNTKKFDKNEFTVTPKNWSLVGYWVKMDKGTKIVFLCLQVEMKAKYVRWIIITSIGHWYFTFAQTMLNLAISLIWKKLLKITNFFVPTDLVKMSVDYSCPLYAEFKNINIVCVWRVKRPVKLVRKCRFNGYASAIYTHNR